MSMLRRRLMNSRKEEELSYTDKYLTIEALEDGVTVSFTNNGLEYCVDGDGNWMSLYEYEDVIIDTGHTLHFRGNLVPDEYYGVGKFRVDNEFNLKGNVMSILYGDDGYLNYSLSGKENAFYELFYLVKGLKSVSPNFLPATTLSAYCYGSMFKGCTKLEKAPDLPAEELVTWCYADMFYGCTRLNYIKALFKTTPSDEYTDYWVSGVNQSGTFVKHPEATWNVVGINGVPEGWTIKFDGEEQGGGTYDDYFGQIPPESTSLEFPLYITVPFVETNDGYRLYERQADNLSLQLREWFFENAEYIDDYFTSSYELYPDNIYINGVKVNIMGAELYLGDTVDDIGMFFGLDNSGSRTEIWQNNDNILRIIVYT